MADRYLGHPVEDCEIRGGVTGVEGGQEPSRSSEHAVLRRKLQLVSGFLSPAETFFPLYPSFCPLLTNL